MQARSIVRGAADCVRGAKEGWGGTAAITAALSLSCRLSSSLSPESLLLALGDADAERGKLLGGVTYRGRGIYRRILSRLDAASEAGTGGVAEAAEDT